MWVYLKIKLPFFPNLSYQSDSKITPKTLWDLIRGFCVKMGQHFCPASPHLTSPQPNPRFIDIVLPHIPHSHSQSPRAGRVEEQCISPQAPYCSGNPSAQGYIGETTMGVKLPSDRIRLMGWFAIT